ncbi:hypothetical protein BVC80_49g26 [Macleaya cordata]|uniref:Uncharacterized protein n=1 Tax=Macleaya cordata TaxID=56857 RepID=A0A200QMY0_MACCD|nr:hypothetical protein BVC80_49g26 [Macleaya cordata]
MSSTEKNPGRRSFKCPLQREHMGEFIWADPPTRRASRSSGLQTSASQTSPAQASLSDIKSKPKIEANMKMEVKERVPCETPQQGIANHLGSLVFYFRYWL